MRVLVTGAHGQLGRALCRSAPPGCDVIAADRAALDIADPAAVDAAITECAPDWVLNAAAFTQVDGAETAPEAAFATNATGAANLARAAARCGARLAYISTDSVFDGAQSRPYAPDAPANPLNVYSMAKRAGEQAVLATIAAKPLVIRTSWLYAAEGRNFPNAILARLRTEGRARVIADQVGTPTWADNLARAIWRGMELDLSGLHHWSDAGVASWYDFAVAVAEEALAAGLLARKPEIAPIRTEDYPLPARRPPYAVLDKTATWAALGYAAEHWREGVRRWARERRDNPDRGGCS